MSELKVNKITPKTGTNIQLGESGDTITIPCGATLTNNGTATGFGLSFCTTVKTSPFTATANKGFLINTGSAVTVTLPASPSVGNEVIIVDQTGQAATNNITLGRNGSKIKGVCVDATMSTNRGGLRLVYSGSSQGWITATAGNDETASTAQYVSATGGTVLTCGNFKTHVFTSDTNFVVSNAGNACGSTTIDYFVVAGGGGGGGSQPSAGGQGGGGAGGFRISNSTNNSIPSPTMSPLVTTTALTASVGTFPISVGAGGTAGGTGSPAGATPGANSVFSTITSAGGGKGGSGACTPTNMGDSGGSGGGGNYSGPYPKTAGAGNTPPVSPPQGNPGGPVTGASDPPGAYGGSGGGGAGAAGSGGNTGPQGYAGGIGSFIADAVFGPTAPSYGTPGPVSSTRYFAGGGGGGNRTPNGPSDPTASPAGGGGSGAKAPYPNPGATPFQGAAGTTNTGGGGGGGNYHNGGAGGSGIVVLRYKFQG